MNRIYFGLLISSVSVLSGCPDPANSPTKSTTASPGSAPVAASTATEKVSASASANASATPTADESTCDVTVVPGERIGDKALAGSPSVKVDVAPDKTYCVFGLKLTSASKLSDVKDAATGCTEAPLIGATHLNCDAQGVALSFAGPPLAFSDVTVYPKGSASPMSARPALR